MTTKRVYFSYPAPPNSAFSRDAFAANTHSVVRDTNGVVVGRLVDVTVTPDGDALIINMDLDVPSSVNNTASGVTGRLIQAGDITNVTW